MAGTFVSDGPGLYVPDGYVDEDPTGSGLYAFTEYTPPIQPEPAAEPTWVALGGLNLSATDDLGVQWALEDLTGWGASAGTLSPKQKPRQAGAWGGYSFSQARPVTLAGTAIAQGPLAASAAADRLISAASLDEVPLEVSESGRWRWCNVRRDGEVIITWLTTVAFKWSVQVVALDPRKFGTVVSGATYLPSTVGGITLPLTFPFTLNATTVSGQVHLDNPGNAAGPVALRIDGPCVGPVVTHVGSGASLVFSSSLVLGSGEWLDIDMEARTVLANGHASRSGWVTSRGWSSFDIGPNAWSFTAASFNSGARLTVTATPSYQ